MTPERYQQIEELFHAALAVPFAERTALLARVGADDPDLQAEVASLLAAHAEAGSFIAQPAVEVAAEIWAEEQAQANAGRRVGPYQILSLLGAGGMGEVYLAQDLRLHRKVALKLLPAQWAKEPERVRRFLKEAQAASALNHPNIITIYEVGQEEQAPYIATEFIDGQTLRQRMTQTPLTFEIVLDLALQVAAALTTAHEAGIIHRDIKPENIMVRRDGLVKVLDFGLAKPVVTLPALFSQTNADSTAPGVILGTLRYVSPEQGRGEKVDARTDIFSFGIVLYELLAGRLPFTGRTPSDVLAAVLTAEPPPLPAQVPLELRRIVERALGKAPEARYQSAAVLLSDLRRLKQLWERQQEFIDESATNPMLLSQLSALPQPTANGRKVATAPQVQFSTSSTRELLLSGIKQHRRSVTAILSVISLAVILAGYGIWHLYQLSQQAQVYQEMKLTKLTTSGKLAKLSVAIAPDGKYAAYVLDESPLQSLWVMHLPTRGTLKIGPSVTYRYDFPTFSQDGSYVYYAANPDRNSMGLYRVPVLGGNAVKILDGISSEVTFSPQGDQFAYIGDKKNALFIANQDGTGVQQIAVSPDNNVWVSPTWSPDGKEVALLAMASQSQEFNLHIIRLADHSIRRLGTERWLNGSSLAWQSNGHSLLLAAADGSKPPQLWAVSYPDGTARRITNDLVGYNGAKLARNSQEVVFVRGANKSNLWVAPRKALTEVQQVSFDVDVQEGMNGNLTWTPDNQVVYSVALQGGNHDLWLLNPQSGQKTQLTVNAGNNTYPVVSPDGQTLVFSSNRNGATGLWQMRLDGSGAQRLIETNGNVRQPQFTLDGQSLIYTAKHDDLLYRLWQLPLAGGTAIQLSDFKLSPEVVLSPDGKRLAAFHRDQPSDVLPKIAIFSSTGGAPQQLLDLPPWAAPRMRWFPDGQHLTLIDKSGRGHNLVALPLNGGPPKQLTTFTNDIIYNFDWSRDGQWLVLARGSHSLDLVLLSDFRF